MKKTLITLKKHITKPFLTLMLLFFVMPAFAGIAIIGNKASNIKSLSLQQIRAIYKDKPVSLAGGVELVPLDQNSNSTLYREFYRDLFNWTPSDTNNYWSSLVFSGQGNPPQAVSSSRDAINTVASYRDTIAYISTTEAENLPNSVHVLYSTTPIRYTKKTQHKKTQHKKITQNEKTVSTSVQNNNQQIATLNKKLKQEEQKEKLAQQKINAEKAKEANQATAEKAAAEKAAADKAAAEKAAATKAAADKAAAEKTAAQKAAATKAAVEKAAADKAAAEKTAAQKAAADKAAAEKAAAEKAAATKAAATKAAADKAAATKAAATKAAAEKTAAQKAAATKAAADKAAAEKAAAEKAAATKAAAQKAAADKAAAEKTASITLSAPSVKPQLTLDASPGQPVQSKSQREENQVSPNLVLDPIMTSGSTQSTIWASMIQGFTMKPETNEPAVKAAIQAFLSKPRSLEKIFNNAQPYIYYIYQQTKLRGIPAELALIPMIESGYNPLAYSGVGATGLWQMMPATASELGLTINWWYDGRGDILASTNKALNYFQSLHNYFDNWPLAIAAYDFGVGSLKKAVKNNKAERLPTDFWSLKLPQETKSYVPKLLALANIISTPGHYGIKLPAIPNKPYFAQVTMDSQITLDTAAKLAEINPKVISELNPGFRRIATDPNGGTYTLLIPEAHLKTFQKNLSAIANVPQTSWIYHQVRRNETLASIARNYHTNVKNLRKANNFNTFAKVIPGQGILVPVKLKRTIKASSYKTGVDSLTATSQYGDETDQVIYTVSNSDSLEGIAQQYGVSPEDIIKWNRLRPNPQTGVPDIRPGQQLRIYLSGSSINVTPTADRVQQGDSLKDIVNKLYNSPSP